MTSRSGLIVIAALLVVPIVGLLASQWGANVRELNGECGGISGEFAIPAHPRADGRSSDLVLITGSTTLSRWRNRPQYLADFHVQYEESPGLTPGVINECFKIIVAKRHPDKTFIVLEPQDVLQNRVDTMRAVKSIMNARAYYALGGRIVFVMPPKSPVLRPFHSLMDDFSDSLASTLSVMEGGDTLNPNKVISTETLIDSGSYFWPDGKTLSDKGYLAITTLLKQEVTSR